MWSRVTEGYGALPAFGLINRSKSETQGQLSRRGGAIRARLGLLFLGSRDRYQVKKIGVVPARSIKSYIMQAVRQVVFTDVLIVGRLDVDSQSFAPIGLHKTDAASDWWLIKRHYIGMKGLPGVQLQK